MNKLKKNLITKTAVILGYHPHFALKLYNEIKHDLKDNKKVPLKDKVWSYRRGFFISSTLAFGVTEDNYKNYLSDLDYFKLYPINNKFRHWIDDKLSMKYVLSEFSEFLPKYYCVLRRGGLITPLIDGNHIVNMQDILNLIKSEKNIALKLISSSSGIGFHKLSYDEGYKINNESVDEPTCIAFLNSIDNYLVTEYVVAHESIRKFSSNALNTVRIMVVNDDAQHVVVANAFMRICSKNTGFVDNVMAGGIFANVDVKTGRFDDAKKIVNSNFVRCNVHPDSNLEISGTLPNWEMMTEKLTEISQFLSPLSYLGYDIALTDSGFKIIEINSHQGIRMYQSYYPLLKDNLASQFFTGHLRNLKKSK